MVAFLGIADLGVGSSLVTAISRAFGANEHARVRQLFANGLLAVGGMAFILLVISACLFRSDVGSLLFPKSPADIRHEATNGVIAFVALFAVALPLTLVGRLQLALQRGHVSNLWQIVAAVLNFGMAVYAAERGMSIPWIVGGLFCGTLLCGVLNLLTQYWISPGLRPQHGDINRVDLRNILGESSSYLMLQIIFMVAYAADTLIVARQLGAESAAAYALSERMFSMVAVAVAVVTGPLWAAYGEAMGASDWSWAKRMLRLSTLRIGLVAIFLSLAILLLLKPLVALLSSGQFVVPLALAVAMAVWRVVEAVGASLSAYLYAQRAVGFVLKAGIATAVISFILKVALVSGTGMAVAPAIMAVCYVVFCLIPSLWYVRRRSSAYAD